LFIWPPPVSAKNTFFNKKELKMNKLDLFKELIDRSRDEKRGLTVYINGNTIVGIVSQVINDQAIELRSQQYHKAVVLLESIEAISVN
jgi:hypothetical protein